MEKKAKVNPKSLANLRPAKKGEIRNPNGWRGNNADGKTLARALLAAIDPNDPQTRTNAEIIFSKQIEQAKRGELDSAMFCFHTAFGRPGQALDVTFSDKQEQLRALFPTREELEQSLKDGNE